MLCFSFSVTVTASTIEKHVLFLAPQTPDYPGTELYEQGLKNTLAKNSDCKFSYSYEYLDLARYPNDEGYLQNTAQYFKAKYKIQQPDFIITTVNLYPLFAKYGNEMFPNVPIIMDWNEDNQPLVTMPLNYVVIPRSIEIDQNIQLIRQTSPLTKKIYMVVGDSADERTIVKRILEVQKKYAGQLEFVLLNDLPYAQMLEHLRNAGDHSAILYLQWFSDVDGKSFVPAQVIQTICREANVPVYGVAIQYLGLGVIGGYVGNQEIIGQTAANVVLDIVSGNKPSDNPVINAPSRTYTFDWRQLKRWGIEENTLPSGSEIMYKPTTVWDLYGRYIIVGIVLLVLQALLIFGLLINWGKRIKAESELSQSNISLEKTVLDRTHELSKANDQLISAKEQLETLNIQLELIARTDSLTGLFNRRHAEEKIQEEYEKYRRNGREFAVVIADIDFFKKVNDAYGHDTGDIILRAVSQSLRESVRAYDTIARWGGEEFLLLLPETKAESAELLVERIRKTVEEHAFAYYGGTLSVTMTFGVSAIRTNDTIVDVIKRADHALYKGKNAGRNCVKSV